MASGLSEQWHQGQRYPGGSLAPHVPREEPEASGESGISKLSSHKTISSGDGRVAINPERLPD